MRVSRYMAKDDNASARRRHLGDAVGKRFDEKKPYAELELANSAT